MKQRQSDFQPYSENSSFPKVRRGGKAPIAILFMVSIFLFGILFGSASCRGKEKDYMTFADYPGFKDYFRGICLEGGGEHLPTRKERELLNKFRPRIVVSPEGQIPVDFYRDYLPFTVMRRFSDDGMVSPKVTRDLLKKEVSSRKFYLDFQEKKFKDEMVKRGAFTSAAYGRIYRERVSFPSRKGKSHLLDLVFLKYNFVFPVSGLAKDLPFGYETLLRLAGLSPDNWHELDNFVAVYIVLEGGRFPVAVMLAQHNHHRTYLIGRDVSLPRDGRIVVDVARRSNEVYLDRGEKDPVHHRVVRWSFDLLYLISGEDAPLFRGKDVTFGVEGGGREVDYTLRFLSPCDPFYRAEMMLGEPRPFFGRYIGRDGPPGADYYAHPRLLPLGNLLKFSYLHDGDSDDIALLKRSIDKEHMKMDIGTMIDHGGEKFYRYLLEQKRH